jgi:hypothetical protein
MPKTPGKSNSAAKRTARLAEELRRNLKRRKAQGRARTAAEAAETGDRPAPDGSIPLPPADPEEPH